MDTLEKLLALANKLAQRGDKKEAFASCLHRAAKIQGSEMRKAWAQNKKAWLA